MKTLTLSLLLIFINVAAHSQKVFHATQSSLGTKDELTQKFVEGERKSIDLYFTVQRGTIMVNDRAHSVYRLGDKAWDNKEAGIAWQAMDERNIPCIIGVVTNRYGQQFLSIYYSDFYLNYLMDKPETAANTEPLY